MIKYSVIIPTYNRSQLLKRCLESLEKQTFRDFEVLVCDDGSTDDTKETALGFQNRLNLTYLYEKNWGGPARPRNRGLQKAKGEWICFLDSDDWWYPGKLETIDAYTGEYDFIFHDLDVFDQNENKVNKICGYPYPKPVFRNLLIIGNRIATSSVCIRKDILEPLQGISEDRKLIGMEDNDYWLRISRHTEKFKYIPLTLGVYWAGDDNLSQVSLSNIKMQLYILRKYKHLLSAPDKKLAIVNQFYFIARKFHKLKRLDWAARLYLGALRVKSWKIKMKSLCFYILARFFHK